MGRLAAAVHLPFIAFAPARGGLFGWVPVMFAIGIGLWFNFTFEPGPLHYAMIVTGLAFCGLFYRLGPEGMHPLVIALMCVLVGMAAAGTRAHLINAPVLEFRYYGPVQGQVIKIDRSQSDMVRLTLDKVVLSQVSAAKTPVRVRVSLHDKISFINIEPGQTVFTTAYLAAPDGPVEPGGFDFRRMAFFDKLGAVGYTRVPVLLLEPPANGAQWVNRIRAQIRTKVEAKLPGDAGAFAAALVTGDRAGISRAAQENLRGSNLAHLLAISGLHMALLTGFIFAALRYGLALFPIIALRINAKKLAAVFALIAGAVYLMLSGGNVATERAFVMVAVMLGAVLCDRRALSLRSVALAACVLLLLQPETLLEPGFQMSFAATIALIAGYGAVRDHVRPGALPFWVMPLFTVVFTSLLAGLATAPIAAAHFNRVAGYGLVANVLAVPVMGLAVMPAAVVAGLLAPFGLEGAALWVMGKGTAWILWVAQTVAGWDGAVRAVSTPPASVLPIMALGALWVVLWRSPIRFAGVIPMVFAFGIWGLAERPPLLISSDGKLVGLLTTYGRALSASKGAGFIASQWLENDGDLVDQAKAARRSGFEGPDTQRLFTYAGWRILHAKGKVAEAQVQNLCAKADLVILGAKLVRKAPSGCRIIDETALRKTGAIAIWPRKDGGLRVVKTENQQRLWTRHQQAPELIYDRLLFEPPKVTHVAPNQ